MNSEIASMKGRCFHYYNKMKNGEISDGEYERAMKDAKRAEKLINSGRLSERDEQEAQMVLEKVDSMRQMENGSFGHEFGAPGGWF